MGETFNPFGLLVKGVADRIVDSVSGLGSLAPSPRRATKPKPAKKEWLKLPDYMTASPYRGGYIISSHGEHMGSIKKTSKGWKYDPLKMGTDPEGKKLRIAAAEIDARESAPAGERKFV